MIRRILPLLFLTLAFSALAIAGRSLKPIAGTFPFSIQVMVSDTNNISSVQISMGSMPGGTDLLNNFTFTYDVKTGLPSGMAYSRRQNMVTLTLGANFVAGTPMYGQYSIIGRAGTAVLTKQFTYK